MSAAKVGDRVRVVIEGAVRHYDSFGPQMIVTAEYAREHTVWIDRPGVSVEVLEPEWQPGDVIHCKDHPDAGPFIFGEKGWVNRFGQQPTYDFTGCDTTLLVRDGKPVTP